MALSANQKLGPYEIIAPVGEGGMGEVYRARDARLNRSVAIKVLPQSIAADAERMRRFEQEARSIAALNHPNILAIYDVGVQDGTSYLVMELLEGETLRERLDRGALPVRKAVEIATQIAYGLAAAHERGIIHRDLKPDNIFLTKDGHVKLLDFGLAKGQSGTTNTISLDGLAVTMRTAPGVVLGTAPYMAPEQVRGEPMDYRADIFSFGAVLYEMLAGRRAFSGDSTVETMNAILKSDPPEIDPAAARISPGLDRILRHCLEKNPSDRFQSARDLIFALGALSGSGPTSALTAIATERRQNRWLWAVAAAAMIAALLIGYLAKSSPPPQRMEFAIATDGEVTHLALSPDGSMLAYVAPDETTGESLVHVQRVGSGEVRHLDGSEGATYPFWSPDAKYVAFFANGKLKKMSISGGAPEVIAIAESARGGTWGKKNVIVYAPSVAGPLWRVNPDGTDAALLTEKLSADNETSHRWPVFLPDGEHFIFWAGDFNQSPDDRHTGIYLSSLAAKQKDLVTLAQSSCGYGQGHLYYVDDKHSLVAVRMDGDKAKLLDRPQVVAARVGRNPSTYWGSFAVADNGTVVYHLGSGATLSQLTWYNRGGQKLAEVGEMGIMANPSLSPDAQRVATDVADVKDRNVDVWIRDLPGRAYTRFTFDPAEETNAVWSHDGKTIAYRSAASPGCIVRLKSASGLEAEHGVGPDRGRGDTIPNSWTHGDTGIVVSRLIAAGGSKLQILSLADGKVTPIVNASGSQYGGQISPDGKWLAYASDESGDWEVYITPFPATGGKLQVSRGGGTGPRWRGDGKEIFYVNPTKQLMSVTVRAEGGLSTGTPVPLFQMHARAPVSSTDIYTYDVTSDGQRFLVNQYAKPAQVPPLNIILNATSNP